MSPYPLADPALLAQVAEDLIDKGWQPVWCPQRQNGSCTPSNNPSVTGYDAPYPTNLPQPPGAHRLGFRVPPSLVIIDVDHYEGKRGADTLDRAEDWLGELPPTYKVTARGLDDPSGRFIFRKPADLDFSNSALNQFANDNGKTDIDILRTGHRFSWAPGDLNHKNHQPVQCYDPDGVLCLMPPVDDPSIPSLPQRWIDYLRNPPKAYSTDAYTRPGDGPQWWLQQPDESLSTDDELKSFAFNMMVSRVPVEDIYPQWLRVAHADDSSWPWDREDFDRHTRGQAQYKAAEVIAREDAHNNSLPASETEREQIAQHTAQTYEREQKLVALREQAIDQAIGTQYMFPVIPLEQETPQQAPAQSQAEFISGLVRGLPHYDSQYKNILARRQAEKDVDYLLSAQFEGYRSIGTLPEPPPPETLYVVGKDSPGTRIIARAAVTVISGHRSSGKTWVTAAWAAQELRAGNTVIWIDFERQDAQLTSKLRMLGVQEHVIDNQVRYTSVLPPAALLIRDVEQAGEGGAHRVLVVIDAFRALQNRVMPGTSANDGDAVEQVYTEYLTPVAEAGANIVLLDHMAKATSGKDPSTFGTERKESAADYVIRVDKIQKFSKKTSGFSCLTLTKARGGFEDEDTPVGYLWVAGADQETGDLGITKYPRVPELRSWAPEPPSCGLGDLGDDEKQARNTCLVSLVAEDRLKYSINLLCRAGMEAYPELFKSEASTKRWIRDLVTDGKLVKEAAQNGKLDIPGTVMEVHSPVPQIDPSQLEHEEE